MYRVHTVDSLHEIAPDPGGAAEQWLESALNFMEKEGWELVAVQGGDSQPPYYFFKHNGQL